MSLKINEQIITEILKKGLKLNETIKDLEGLCLNYNEDVNQINICKESNVIKVYLINHDDKLSKWDYLNNHDRIILPLHEEKNVKKWVESLIDNLNKKKLLSAQKPLDGYRVQQLKNNKPLTLLDAKNANFCCFVAVNWGFFSDGTPRYNEINISIDKKESDSHFLGLYNNCWDAKQVRKEATHIFAIYNKNMSLYRTKKDEKIRKQTQRAENKELLKQEKRYFYNEKDFNRLHSDFNFTCWGVAYAFNGPDCEPISNSFSNGIAQRKYISYKGDKIYHDYKTRKDLFFGLLVDKNGHFKLDKIYQLRKKAEQLKKQRENERREKAQAEWINSDHAHQKTEIDFYLYYLKTQILNRADFDSVLNGGKFEELKKMRELYKKFANLLNFEKFSAERWEEEKNETIEEYNFYILAIQKGIFDRLACFHHYERTATGYQMKANTDQFWRDSSRYIQAF